jgi:cyclophilin family peptidyl-prolyl cis-trans isomerase
MRTVSVLGLLICGLWASSAWLPAQTADGPVIVVETSRGTFAFETYPAEAPKTVMHVVELVKRRFYDGQRFHRVVPGFVIQWGDPRSRNESQEAQWGRGPAASSGTPVGAAELSKKRTHTKGAVAMAHSGDPALGDSQLYVTLEKRDDLNGKYAVFGHVVSGLDVPERIQRGDVIRRMYVKE